VISEIEQIESDFWDSCADYQIVVEAPRRGPHGEPMPANPCYSVLRQER
jgi:hypothetical protein